MHSSDLLAEIRASRPAAPTELRERIRALAAAEESRPARTPLLDRLRIRRAALVVIPAAAVVAVATAGAIGLARSGGGEEPFAGSALTAPYAERESAPPQTGADAAEDSTAQTAPAQPKAGVTSTVPAPDPGRLQRYSASLVLRVEDVDDLSAATQRALRITRELGGYVVSAQTDVPERGRGSSQLVLRVPRERVQDGLARYAELGTILAQSTQLEDLQVQADDLGNRIADLTAEIARLQAQLARPNLPAETRARLATRLADARRERDDLRASRGALVREAEFATVTLGLTTEEDAAVPATSGRLDRAVDEARAILAWEAAAVLYVLAALGPVVLLALAVWLVVRTLRRRGDERLLEQA